MPHPSRTVDEPTKRIAPDALPPPERAPSEMLAALTLLINRQVASLEAVAKANGGALPEFYSDELDAVLERVCKLSREDRATEPTDEQLLAAHDAKAGA
jgi:hypothetical protein